MCINSYTFKQVITGCDALMCVKEGGSAIEGLSQNGQRLFITV